MARPKWNGKRIDKEIGIVSLLVGGVGEWVGISLHLCIAGGKDRDGRLSRGLAGTSCRRWRRDEASPSFYKPLSLPGLILTADEANRKYLYSKLETLANRQGRKSVEVER